MESYILEFEYLPTLFHARMNVNIIRRAQAKENWNVSAANFFNSVPSKNLLHPKKWKLFKCWNRNKICISHGAHWQKSITIWWCPVHHCVSIKFSFEVQNSAKLVIFRWRWNLYKKAANFNIAPPRWRWLRWYLTSHQTVSPRPANRRNTTCK